MRYRKVILFIAGVQFMGLCLGHVLAQEKNPGLYQFPTGISDDYVVDPLQVYSDILFNLNVSEKERDKERYAEIMAFGKQDLFTHGKVYLGWAEMENYLQKVMQQVLPDELKDQGLRVYLTRSPSMNAFVIHDGSVFINVGLLARTTNEAGLATIIGHEVAHYMNEDVEASFFRKLKQYTRKNRYSNYEMRVDNAAIDRNMERLADSLGFVLAYNGGYNIEYGLNNFYKFLAEEEISRDKEKKRKRKIVNVGGNKNEEEIKTELLMSHPKAEERIETLKNYLHKFPTEHKGAFMVSEEDFFKLRDMARKETLHILLENTDYRECVEMAFRFYLYDPEDDQYVYYLLEGIRRLLYVDPLKGTKGFLTEDYYKYFGKGEGILNDLEFIFKDMDLSDVIMTNELVDDAVIEFDTYDEAFEYFKELSVKRGIAESYLTMALHFRNSIDDMILYLNTYLSFDPINYRDFAEALLYDQLFTELRGNGQDILLIDRLNCIEDHRYGYHRRYLKAEENTRAYFPSLSQVISKYYPDYKLLAVSEVRDANYQKYMDYMNLLYLALFFEDRQGPKEDKVSEAYYFDDHYKEKEKEQKHIYYLDPYSWYFMRENEIKSFQYVSVTSFDDQTRFLNPFLRPFVVFTALLQIVSMEDVLAGSARYAYEVEMFKFDTQRSEYNHYSNQVYYKMSQEYLNNTIYHLLKEQEHEE